MFPELSSSSFVLVLALDSFFLIIPLFGSFWWAEVFKRTKRRQNCPYNVTELNLRRGRTAAKI
jgi:hypothetical protein